MKLLATNVDFEKPVGDIERASIDIRLTLDEGKALIAYFRSVEYPTSTCIGDIAMSLGNHLEIGEKELLEKISRIPYKG